MIVHCSIRLWFVLDFISESRDSWSWSFTKVCTQKERVYQYDAVLYFVDNDVLMILIGEYSDN